MLRISYFLCSFLLLMHDTSSSWSEYTLSLSFFCRVRTRHHSAISCAYRHEARVPQGFSLSPWADRHARAAVILSVERCLNCSSNTSRSILLADRYSGCRGVSWSSKVKNMDCRFVRVGFLYMILPCLCGKAYYFLVNNTSETRHCFLNNQSINAFLRDD